MWLIFEIIVVSFLVVRFLVTLFNFMDQPLLYLKTKNFKKGWSDGSLENNELKVSILIPARNEADNIGQLLDNLISLSDLKYFTYEILVLDDQSEDATAAIVDQYVRLYPKVRLIKGLTLPTGWTGKNWACHQLAISAKGQYLLFLDADVRLKDEAIVKSIYRVKYLNISLLSLFPQQITKSWGEKLVVPLMHFLLINLLPLRLVRTSKYSSLAAANGQFMLFESNVYNQYYFHEKVKSSVLDDVQIIRFAKRQKLKVEVLLGNRLVFCRMYHSGREAVNGFSKNLFAGFQYNVYGFLIYFLLIFWLWIPIITLSGGVILLICCILIVLERSMISSLSGQSLVSNLILHPVQMATYAYIGFQSMILHFTGTTTWKGRTIPK